MKNPIPFYTKRFFCNEFNETTLGFHTEQENVSFEKRLRGCKRYLEWGMGASTVVAARLGVSTISIESDKIFLEAVRRSIRPYLASGDIQLIHRDIGLIGPWGSPVIDWFAPITKARELKFKNYSDPELHFEEGLPDLVLIDGRFRVACALKTLRYFYKFGHSSYEICVDDYIGRPEYHILNQWFELTSAGSEMAVFTPLKNIDTELLEAVIASFELKPD